MNLVAGSGWGTCHCVSGWIAQRSIGALMGFVLLSSTCWAQLGTLAEPFPTPAANAALHYQRALLQLAKMDGDRVTRLDQPIWVSLPQPLQQQVPHELTGLLYRARFAVQAATKGSRITECNFGIDFGDAGAATQLPHLDGMLRLGRLLTLQAALSEAKGEWEEAAVIYFDGLRIGRHMTHQSTLLEAIVGMQILRDNYYGLARWAVRCPSTPLVARAFGLLESMQSSLVNPEQVLAREASVMAMEFDRLRSAYPDGDWAEIILLGYDQTPSGIGDQDQAAARRACVERGVPDEIFATDDTFLAYLAQVEAANDRFIEAMAACASLPASAWLRRGEVLSKKYSVLLNLMGDDGLLDPVDTGILFAEHAAELAVARVTLAVAASKRDGKYPTSLDDVKGRFGGVLIENPYGAEAMDYQTHHEDQEFSVEIAASGQLPRVAFSSNTPAPAQ